MKGQSVQAQISGAWQRIEQAIERLGGTNLFNGPATDEQIADLEKQLGIALPDELVAHLKCHNGNPDFLEELLVNKPFLTTERIHEDWQINCEVDSDSREEVDHDGLSRLWWHQRVIPIAGADGDSVCIDSVSGKMYSHVHDSGLGEPIASGLAEWLESLADRIEAGEAELDSGKVILDLHD